VNRQIQYLYTLIEAGATQRLRSHTRRTSENLCGSHRQAFIEDTRISVD
jgi:hypothetical protein